jgi:hypothetical protein
MPSEVQVLTEELEVRSIASVHQIATAISYRAKTL